MLVAASKQSCFQRCACWSAWHSVSSNTVATLSHLTTASLRHCKVSIHGQHAETFCTRPTFKRRHARGRESRSKACTCIP